MVWLRLILNHVGVCTTTTLKLLDGFWVETCDLITLDAAGNEREYAIFSGFGDANV